MSLILIVEDHEKNMKLVRDILQFHGHTVQEARNGSEGLRLAALPPPPDLILMDIQLPDIDGIEVLQRLRRQPALDAVPVLAVSASVMAADHQHIVASGFDAFVTKPISLKPFVATVTHFLQHGRAAGPRP